MVAGKKGVKVFLDEEKQNDENGQEREETLSIVQSDEKKGAVVLFGSKLKVSCEDTSSAVFVDPKRLQANAKSVTVKKRGTGLRPLPLRPSRHLWSDGPN